MKLIQNAVTFFLNPEIAQNYFKYWESKLTNSGQSIRVLPDGIKVTALSGFSEFHSCNRAVSYQEREFLQKYPLGTGDLIDIGANLGIVSAVLAKRYLERQVHAFEPNPSTFKSLQANIAINNLTNIQAQQCAVAEHNGKVSFRADPIHRATCSMTNSAAQYTMSVPCTTLDSYIEKQCIKEISFLKVDVEGYETLVFQGAKDILQRQLAQLIYYEVCPVLTQQAGFDPELPTQILLENGYQLRKIENGSLIPVYLQDVHKADCENWIAIPK